MGNVKGYAIDGYVVDANLSYKRHTYVSPNIHNYDNGVKYSCPVCDILGNRHSLIYLVDNCPLCNVNLYWKETMEND